MATMSGQWPGCGGPGDWGEHLVRRGTITQKELDTAREASHDPIRWLIDQGVVSEKVFYEYQAMKSGKFFVDLDQIPYIFDAYVLSLSQALEFRALPLKKDGDNLWVAFYDSDDSATVEQMTALTGLRVFPVVASPSQIDARLAHFRESPDLWPVEPPSRDPGKKLLLGTYITADQLADAHAASDDPIRWLLDQDVIGEHEFAMARAWEHQMMYFGPSDGSWRNRAPEFVPQEIARRLNILPLDCKEDTLCVAVSDPRDWGLIRRAEEALGLRLDPTTILQARDLAEALTRDD